MANNLMIKVDQGEPVFLQIFAANERRL